MFNILSKNAWISHVLEGYVGHALQRTTLSQQTQGYLVALTRSLVFTILAGGLIVYTDGHIFWMPTLATFVLMFIRTVQHSPIPREVWSDADRIAHAELLKAQAKLEEAALQTEVKKEL